MDEGKEPYEVIALWDGFEPEVFEEWPTRREAIHSARLNNLCRESEHVSYAVRPKPVEECVKP